ncbi:MAG: ABC transporter ATP-binding protein [Spirochaetia bacterium]
MSLSLNLKKRKYTIFDAAGICLRVSPAAAFFYGFLDLTTAFLVPIRTLAIGRFIDSAIQLAGESQRVQSIGFFEMLRSPELSEVFINLSLILLIIAYQWLKRAIHNFADLKLVLDLREKYRSALSRKAAEMDYRYVEDNTAWDLIQRVRRNPEGGELKRAYFHLIDLTAFIIKVGGLLLILSRALWWGGPLMIAVSSLTLISGIRGGKAQYEAERAVAALDRQSTYLSSIMTAREPAAERTLFGFTPFLNRQWRTAYDTAARVRIRTRAKWYRSAYTGNIITILSWVFMMLILLKPLVEGNITVGLYIALTQAFTGLNIVWGFMETVHGISQDAEYFKDLSTLLALPARTRNGKTMLRSKPASIETVELDNVVFRYPGSDERVLDGVSFTFEVNKRYALVGINGAGKTTLTRLITGLFVPDSGEIRINGIPLDRYTPEDLNGFFSVVYQDFARYDLTLKDNILLGHSGQGVAEQGGWDELLSKTGLTETVRQLPRGIDTDLGKLKAEGTDVSGGQWQRIAMARALAAGGRVLILDEPAAALDPLEESRLYGLFSSLARNRTSLLISHRLGSTRTADEIILLSGGKIAETGPHDLLMKQNGIYRNMFESQRSWYEVL